MSEFVFIIDHHNRAAAAKVLREWADSMEGGKPINYKLRREPRRIKDNAVFVYAKVNPSGAIIAEGFTK